MADPLTFVLDGAPVSVSVDPKTSTLDVLRESLGVFAIKAGCSPQGLCGCCLVLVDGKPRLTCTLPVKSVVGKSITTLAGLSDDERARLADAFVETGASQCGYCTPGIVLSTHALLEANAAPTAEEVVRALNLHTCRCTGYTAILAGVDRAAALRRGDAPPATRSRPEGTELVLGERPFVDDLVRPGMLHAVPVFPPRAGTVTKLELPDGVVRVLRGVGETVAHAGDAVALVAAGSAAEARALARAAVVEVAAADRIDFERSTEVVAEATSSVTGAPTGIVHRVEDTVSLTTTDPVFLEPEAALAVPGADGLVVYSATQDPGGVAAAIGARVVALPSGGSYGGKAGVTVEGYAAGLARQTGRPVRVSVDLEEGMRLHPKRPAARARVSLAATATGRLVSARVRVWLDGGAACVDPEKLVADAVRAFPYACDDLELTATVLRTDGPPAGPVRGAATLPVAYAVERTMDTLAAATGLSPRALREANLPAEGQAVLRSLADVDGAVAVARTPTPGGARVVLRVVAPDEVEVQCNVPELGQGRDEALVRALTITTGLPPEVFTVAWGDAEVVGRGVVAPVEAAAAAAGHALAEGGGGLRERVGMCVVAEAPTAGPDGWAAAVVQVDAQGAVTRVATACATGTDQDPSVARNLAEGAAHMGVGVALSEEVETPDGVPEGRFRYLGVLKPKVSPPLDATAVVLGGGAREVSDAVFAATAAAVGNAVAAFEGSARRALPMKDSAAARAVGVRPPRPGPAATAG